MKKGQEAEFADVAHFGLHPFLRSKPWQHDSQTCWEWGTQVSLPPGQTGVFLSQSPALAGNFLSSCSFCPWSTHHLWQCFKKQTNKETGGEIVTVLPWMVAKTVNSHTLLPFLLWGKGMEKEERIIGWNGNKFNRTVIKTVIKRERYRGILSHWNTRSHLWRPEDGHCEYSKGAGSL